MYQPKTGVKCSCKKGIERDNCSNCEGTGQVIDFKAIRERTQEKKKNKDFINSHFIVCTIK